MESFDLFVFVHGFYHGKHFVPVEFGFAEIGGNESVSLLLVNLGKREDLKFTHWNDHLNLRLRRKVHGISKKYLRDRGHFQTVDIGFLPAFFKYHVVDRNLRLGCRGKCQKKLLMDIVGPYVDIVDVESFFPRRLLFPDHDAPYLHHGRFHRDGFEKNCAARISWTYARIIRRWFLERRDFFERDDIRNHANYFYPVESFSDDKYAAWYS